MSKNAIFITVRSASTRLPNKAHLKINGKKTIEYVIQQAKKSKLADTIVLCTTLEKEDDALYDVAKNSNIECFRGSVLDKLDRWQQAAKEHKIDFFVTADGDDLFCSSELMDLAFKQRKKNNSEFIEAGDIICGSFTYGISTEALNKACSIKDSDDTEMMWVYFTKTNICKIEKLKNVPDIYKRQDIRMTLDYQEDFDFFSKVINHFDGIDYTTRDVVEYLNENEEVRKINFFLEEKWRENQKNKTNLVVK